MSGTDGPAALALSITRWDPVVVEIDQPIGQDELWRVRIGVLVLVVTPELAEDIADAIIEAAADRAAAVSLG